MTALPLDVELAGLLNGHHLVAHVEGDRVVLPAAGAWADLRLYESAAGRFVMEVRTALPGGSVLLDTWAAWGATQQEARRDGLAAFCRGTFHVLLALWGILETDQVAHEVRTVAGRNWDVYLGPLVNRQSAGGAGLVPPTDFADAVLAIIDARMRDEAAHVVRIYHAMSQGKAMVTEALSIYEQIKRKPHLSEVLHK